MNNLLEAIKRDNLLEAIKRHDIEYINRFFSESDEQTRKKTVNSKLLFKACKFGAEILDIFLNNGVNINIKDFYFGRTPLHHAAFKNNVEAINLLLEKGADVNIKDNLGLAPLKSAALKNNVEATNLLLKKGAHINTQDKYGRTPLHMASDTNNVEAINLLLESWAYINIQDNLGQTPLHNAAYNNNVDAILLLLKNGADTSINKDGKIPLDLAQPASFAANLIAKLSEISIQNITNQQMLYCFVKSLHKYYNSHFTVASYCDYTFEEGLEGDLLCCFINDEGYFTLNNTELRHLKKAILENKDAHDTEDLAYKEVLMTFKGYFDYFKNTNSSNRNVFFQGEESKKLSEEFCINILDCFIQIDVSTDRKFKDFLKEKYVKAEVASDIDLSSAISGISFSSCNQGAQKF